MRIREDSNFKDKTTDNHCLCGSELTTSSILFSVDDNIAIRRCDACGLAFEFPVPFDSSEECSTNFSPDVVHVKPETFDECIGFARLFLSHIGTKEYLSGKRLLDVGCGCGELLMAAQESGMHVCGVEINPYRRAPLLEKGFNVVTDLGGLSGQKFDIITATHVLEHIPDLNKYLREISLFLDSGSLLCFTLPNVDSCLAKILKSHWNGLGVGVHRWQFNMKTISDVLQRQGYVVKSIGIESLGKYMNRDGKISYSNAFGIINPLGQLSWKGILFLTLVIDKITNGRFGMALRKFGEERGGDNMFVLAGLKDG